MANQYIIFNVNDEDFGIEITHVKEIVVPPEIFKVPNAPEFIEGLINLRGKVLTVFNLRKKFGAPSAAFDENTKIVIVNLKSMVVGFIVDEVDQILRVEAENMEATPESIISTNQKYIDGVAKIGEKIILILDLDKIISVSEKEEIKSLTSEQS